MVDGGDVFAATPMSCSNYLYRNYDNVGSSYLTSSSDSYVMQTISYQTSSSASNWPTNSPVAPTRNGYSFDGGYIGSTQYLNSSLAGARTAPASCSNFLSHWTLTGCAGGVDNIDYSPPTSVTTAGTTSVSSSGWTVELNTNRQLSGYWACSNIPGGYNAAYGYSTAVYGAMSASATTGNYCWCRLNKVGSLSGAAWVGPMNGYSYTQWVYSGTNNTSCSTNNNCATYCANKAAGTANTSTLFRKTLYGQNCPFTIQYDNTSGHTNSTLTPTSYTYETAPVTLPVPVPSNSSEAFAGWYTSSSFSGSPVTTISQTTSDTANKHYYAKWVSTYNVSYNCGTGGSGTPPATHSCGAGLSCTASSTVGSCSKPGDAFRKWNCTGGGNTFDAELGDAFTMPSAAVICTAQWSCDTGYDYFIDFNQDGKLNANLFATDNMSIPINTALNGSATTTNSNYVPGEWEANFVYGKVRGSAVCTSNSSGGVSPGYTIGQYCWCAANMYMLDGDSTYYGFPVNWMAMGAYGFTYSGIEECAKLCPEDCSKVFGDNTGLDWRGKLYGQEKEICVTHIYDIKYWNVEENASYGSNVSWPQNYPVKPSVYTIISPSFAISRPDRSDCYYMDKWCENGALSLNCAWPKVVALGSTGDKDFYAKWLDKNYTITLNKNGGTGVLSFHYTSTGNNNSSLTTSCCGIGSPNLGLPPAWGANNTLAKTGNVFTGWSPSSNVVCNTNRTITAQWCACSGATCTPGTNVSSCSMTGTVTDNQCNYSFSCGSGYNYNNSSSGTGSAAAGSCPAVTSPACSGNILDLVWYRETTGATPLYQNPNPSTCQYGGNMSPLVPPTKPGYTFGGWTVTTQR